MGHWNADPIVYLDYNATMPIRPEVLAAMTNALSTVGNASSVYRLWRATAEAVDRARSGGLPVGMR